MPEDRMLGAVATAMEIHWLWRGWSLRQASNLKKAMGTLRRGGSKLMENPPEKALLIPVLGMKKASEGAWQQSLL